MLHHMVCISESALNDGSKSHLAIGYGASLKMIEKNTAWTHHENVVGLDVHSHASILPNIVGTCLVISSRVVQHVWKITHVHTKSRNLVVFWLFSLKTTK